MKKAHRSASNLFQRTALCAALSLSILGSAQALTLGRPVVQSKQGEALRAEIDINEITAAEQIELQANLASQEIYKAAQIEWPTNNGAPLEIQIQLWRRDNGKPYLKISSQQPVNSKFLDLLIDLRWANGRLLRDISVSLDDGNSQKTKKPVIGGLTEGSNKAATPAAVTANGQILVKRGDTASELSVNKIPAGVSLDQMLLALLRSNPDAFVDANVNRMKEGALLTLPSEEEAKSVSREEARKAIQVQTRDFEAYRAELAARAPGGQVPQVTRDATGKLEAQVQNKNAKTNQDKLTLSKPGRKDAAVEDNIAKQREAKEVADAHNAQNVEADLSAAVAQARTVQAAIQPIIQPITQPLTFVPNPALSDDVNAANKLAAFAAAISVQLVNEDVNGVVVSPQTGGLVFANAAGVNLTPMSLQAVVTGSDPEVATNAGTIDAKFSDTYYATEKNGRVVISSAKGDVPESDLKNTFVVKADIDEAGVLKTHDVTPSL